MEIESLLKVPGIDIKEIQVSYYEGRKKGLRLILTFLFYFFKFFNLFIQSLALLMTAGHGHQDIIEFLIDSGANVNAQDEVYIANVQLIISLPTWVGCTCRLDPQL